MVLFLTCKFSFRLSSVATTASGLAYAFTDIIDLVRDGHLNLTIPEEFPETNLTKFVAKNMDFTEYHGGNGINFYETKKLVEENEEALAKALEKGYISSFGGQVYQDVQETLALGEYGADYLKGLFLSFHRSLEQDVACVYSIVKDTYVSLRSLCLVQSIFLHC